MRALFLFLALFFFKNSFSTGHTISINQANPTCSSSCNGSATASVTGGVGPFQYEWFALPGMTPFATTQVVTGTCEGSSYVVKVTDLNDFSYVSDTVTFGLTPLNVYLSSSQTTICSGSCATIISSVTGGTAPYNYTWSNGEINASTYVCPTATTNYQLTVTDQNGCTGVVSTTIIVSQAAITVTPINTTLCWGAYTILTASGGMSYSWTPSTGLNAPVGATVVSSPSSTTTYTVTGTNSSGCYAVDYAIVNVINLTSATASVTNATCGLSNGSATVTVPGYPFPYDILWSSGQTTSTVNNLPPGAYSYTVSDLNNSCSDTGHVTINSINGPALNPTISQVTCTNQNIGSIAVNATGASPFTYSWSNGSTAATLTNLIPGIYSVVVTDANSCASVGTYEIQQPSNLTLYPGSNTANCLNNGTAMAYISGGTSPYTVSWTNNGTPLTNTWIGGTSIASVPNVAGGTYSIIVTDNLGCSDSIGVLVNYDCLNTIKGIVYFDNNSNCIKETSEALYPNLNVQATNGLNYFYGTTSGNGGYSINLPTGNYSVSILSSTWNSNVQCPSGNIAVINLPSSGDTITQDFAIDHAPYEDVQVNVNPGIARPGFQQIVTVNVVNNGTLSTSGTVTLNFDPTLTLYVAMQNGTLSGNSITWNYGPLSHTAGSLYTAYFTAPATIPLGDTLFYNSSVTPLNDANPTNNLDTAFRIVVGAYDPNAKSVTPAGDILASDSILTYTIDFQNTGTDTAFNIIVIDTLSQYLDPGSIEFAGSSHACTYTLSGQNVVTWKFPNILLPDSNINEPASHGSFRFKIKVKPGIPVGSVIDNFVDIYFDFNAPVRTDTARNILVSPLTIKNENLQSIKVFPVPAKDIVTFTHQDAFNEITISDVSGKIVRHINNLSTKTYKLDLSDISSGTYIYVIKSSENTSYGRLLISK